MPVAGDSDDAQLDMLASTHAPEATDADVEFGVAWSVAAASAPDRGSLLLALQIDGRPKPKGNAAARVFQTSTGEHVASVFERRGLNRPWRKVVRKAVEAVWGKRPPHEGEVVLEVIFMFARPKKHHVAQDLKRPLRADAPRRCTSHSCGDLGKLLRCVEDEITDAGMWTDDRLIVGYGQSTKLWSDADRALIRVLEAR